MGKVHPIIAELTVIRLTLGVTQYTLATRMGMKDQCSISHWEVGKYCPSGNKLFSWVDALGYKLVLEPKEENEI